MCRLYISDFVLVVFSYHSEIPYNQSTDPGAGVCDSETALQKLLDTPSTASDIASSSSILTDYLNDFDLSYLSSEGDSAVVCALSLMFSAGLSKSYRIR